MLSMTTGTTTCFTFTAPLSRKMQVSQPTGYYLSLAGC
jgi:hypothetical protein